MFKLADNLINPKYCIVKGAHINNKAVFTLVIVDTTHKHTSSTVRCKRTGKEFYKSDIYKSIRTFKQLVKWGRLLAPSRTKPLYWTVLENKEDTWH